MAKLLTLSGMVGSPLISGAMKYECWGRGGERKIRIRRRKKKKKNKNKSAEKNMATFHTSHSPKSLGPYNFIIPTPLID